MKAILNRRGNAQIHARGITCFGGSVILFIASLGIGAAADAAKVPVVDGVVMPRRPIPDAIRDAMTFLKKADGSYKPGKINGELAGYFTTAHVNEDGSRSDRSLAFPARQHGYFIFTFLRYGKYSGQDEWLIRARDLADWNLVHSTPSNAVYGNIPWSAYTGDMPGGSADKDSTEPDKAAFLGSAYLALFEDTQEENYLAGARAIADTLCRHQRKDGSWPFRVVPQDGIVRLDPGGAPVFYVQFFEDLQRHAKSAAYKQAGERALELMLDRNIKKNIWGTYHEDVKHKPDDRLSAEPMCFTATYLFRHSKAHPEYIQMGRQILQRLEERLVHTEGHPAAPAPAVSEQEGFEHMMPGHTARYCLSLAELYKASGDEGVKRQAISGLNALTYMQSDAGLFRTFFQLHNEKLRSKPYPNWYSQHLYTVCHVLEVMPILSEIAKR
jgi:hypothetical protein